MNFEFRKFVPNVSDQTFVDSQKLMANNFADPSAISADFLRWLFIDNPHRKGLGYIAYHANRAVAQLFVNYQRIDFDGQQHIIGFTSNACTDSEYRNKGLSQKLFDLIVQESKKTNTAFLLCYPNIASLNMHFRAGFRLVRYDNLEIIPISYFGILKELKKKKKIEVIGSTEDLNISLGVLSHFQVIQSNTGFFLKDDKASTWHVPLDSQQLNWRFLKHPNRKYYIYRHYDTDAVVVLRFIELFGMKTAVIMKISSSNHSVVGRVISDLKIDLAGKINFMMKLSSSINFSEYVTDFLQGRFKIPSKISPRKFPLVVLPLSEKVNITDGFEFSFGDYEVL